MLRHESCNSCFNKRETSAKTFNNVPVMKKKSACDKIIIESSQLKQVVELFLPQTLPSSLPSPQSSLLSHTLFLLTQNPLSQTNCESIQADTERIVVVYQYASTLMNSVSITDKAVYIFFSD